MTDSLQQVLADVAAIGGRLEVVGDQLEYVGDVSALTPDLRAAIKRHKADLVELLRPPSIAEMVAQLAKAGVWISVEEDGVWLNSHGTPLSEAVPAELWDELAAREAELVAWLRKPATEATNRELETLGYSPEIRKCKPEEPGWTPTPEWLAMALKAEGESAAPARAPESDAENPSQGGRKQRPGQTTQQLPFEEEQG